MGATRTADQVIEIAESYPELKAALIAVAGEKGGESISNARLDRWLHSHTYTFFHGLLLCKKYNKNGSCGWTLVATDQAVGEGSALFST